MNAINVGLLLLHEDKRQTERLREKLLGCNGNRDLSEIRFLLTRGARVNDPYKNENLETTYAVVEILQNKHWNDDWVFQKMRLLCRFGADVNVSDATGKTPLDMVMYHHNGCNQPKQDMLEIRVGRLLLQYGAKMAPAIRTGASSILCYTVRRKTIAHMLLLLQIGVNVDEIEEETGRNALMIAMDLNRWDAANLLLRRGASSVLRWYDTNDERWYELNLLHEACYTGKLDRIKCLAEHEVEWAKKNVWWYMTPIVLARHRGHFDAAYYLVQRMVRINLFASRGY